jgi:hypothetical protein
VIVKIGMEWNGLDWIGLDGWENKKGSSGVNLSESDSCVSGLR